MATYLNQEEDNKQYTYHYVYRCSECGKVEPYCKTHQVITSEESKVCPNCDSLMSIEISDIIIPQPKYSENNPYPFK